MDVSEPPVASSQLYKFFRKYCLPAFSNNHGLWKATTALKWWQRHLVLLFIGCLYNACKHMWQLQIMHAVLWCVNVSFLVAQAAVLRSLCHCFSPPYFFFLFFLSLMCLIKLENLLSKSCGDTFHHPSDILKLHLTTSSGKQVSLALLGSYLCMWSFGSLWGIHIHWSDLCITDCKLVFVLEFKTH